jgi:hypothetical protein
MTVGLILESLVAVLLAATVYYCILLNKRLSKLRDGQDEFTALVRELNDATRRAQNSVTDLKSSTVDTAKQLEEQVAVGRVLMDELAMITESGNNLANRLERQLTGGNDGRTGAAPKPLKEPSLGLGMGPDFDDGTPDADTTSKRQSETERELLRTLREVR